MESSDPPVLVGYQITFGEEDKELLVASSISTTANGFCNQPTREDQSFPYLCPF